jgi:hypothetical protein
MRQQLGTTPANAADAATKSYVDTAVANAGSAPSYKTIATANQWVRIARVTMPAQYDGASANVDLVGVPDGFDSVNVVSMKIRAGQRGAIGTNPAADIVLTRATTMTTANVGYVVVQNTPTSIVDFYVQIQAQGRAYQIYAQPSLNVNGTFTLFNQDAGSSTTPSGLVFGSTSTDNEWNSGQKAMFSLAPPIGGYDIPAGILPNTGTGVAQTTGRMYIQPWVIGPSGFTVDQAAIRMSTPQSGGTTTAYVAVYGTDQYGLIDTSQRLMLSNSFVLTTSAATIYATFPTPTFLPIGLYWVAYLYVQTSAPTTQALVVGINNSTWALPNLSGVVGTSVRGYYYNTTVSTPPTTAIAFNSTNWSQTANTDVPQIMLRRSA